MGSTAIALGIAVVPAAAAAGATAKYSTPGLHRGHISAPRIVNYLAASREHVTGHPHLSAPALYARPSAVAAQRAAAVRSGGRRTGLVAIAPSHSSLRTVTPPRSLADFPTMSLKQQTTDFGDQNVQDRKSTRLNSSHV